MKIEQLERTQFLALDASLVAYQSQIIDNVAGVHLPQVINRQKYSEGKLELMRHYAKGMQEAQNQETLDKYATALKNTYANNPAPAPARSYYLFQFELAIRRMLKKGNDSKKTMKTLDRELNLIGQNHGLAEMQDYDSKDTAEKLATLKIQADNQAFVDEFYRNVKTLDFLSDETKEMRAHELLAQIHQDKDYLDPAEMEALTMQDKLNNQIDAVTAVRKEYIPEVHSLTEMAKEWIPNSFGMALGVPGVIFALVATSAPVLWVLAIGALIPSVVDFSSRVFDQLQEKDEEDINKLDMTTEATTAADEFISHFVEPEEVDLDIDNLNPVTVPDPKPEHKLAPNETEKTFWEKAKPWAYTGLAVAGLALGVLGLPGVLAVGGLAIAITGLAISVGVGIGLAASFIMTKMKLSKVDKEIETKQAEFMENQKDNMSEVHIKPKPEKLLGVDRDHVIERNAENRIQNNVEGPSNVIEEVRVDAPQNNDAHVAIPKAPSPKPNVVEEEDDDREGKNLDSANDDSEDDGRGLKKNL